MLTGEPDEEESLRTAWERDDYGDQTKAINVLMNHSDCDGMIPHGVCQGLADDLEHLADKMPDDDDDMYGMRAQTLRFAAGLRSAHEDGENVEFH